MGSERYKVLGAIEDRTVPFRIEPDPEGSGGVIVRADGNDPVMRDDGTVSRAELKRWGVSDDDLERFLEQGDLEADS